MSPKSAGLGLALILAGSLWSAAQAAPVSPGNNQPGPADPLPIEKAQAFFWGGFRYCFYWDGWHGPGWYRCGYQWRRNYGWGGGPGWHGWHHPPPPKKGLPPPPKKGPPPPPPKKGPPPPPPKKGP
jgi:hypothetical protein